MWPFIVGGILQGLLMNMDFKSWRIGLVFGTFMYAMGKVYETCQVLNTLPNPSFHPFFITSSQNIIT
jgi:hypothetical protein